MNPASAHGLSAASRRFTARATHALRDHRNGRDRFVNHPVIARISAPEREDAASTAPARQKPPTPARTSAGPAGTGGREPPYLGRAPS